MPQNFQNYIVGAWYNGETNIENINPSDLSDRIGLFAQANRRRAQTGLVNINLPTAGTNYPVPFGGRGSSSYGSREHYRCAEEFDTAVKTSYIAAGQPD